MVGIPNLNPSEFFPSGHGAGKDAYGAMQIVLRGCAMIRGGEVSEAEPYRARCVSACEETAAVQERRLVDIISQIPAKVGTWQILRKGGDVWVTAW